MRAVPDILKSIEDALNQADTAMWENLKSPTEYVVDSRGAEFVQFYLDRAFLQTLLFLEAQGLPRMLSYAEGLYQKAKQAYTQIEVTPDFDPYLNWSSELRQVLSAIEASYGEPDSTAVSKDLVQILRNCLYGITAACFVEPPQDEAQVHDRIEAVLKCMFPDLRSKPPIGKPIKNFIPDTGLPSLRTLIEYKFISDDADVKRVADEVLADTRGYVSNEWERFVYVIYETRRVRTESEWNQLLRASRVGENVKVVVLQGELARKVNPVVAGAGPKSLPKGP